MSTKYKFIDKEAVYFVTATTVGCLPDMIIQAGVDVFTRNIYREILLDSFWFCQKNQGAVDYYTTNQKGMLDLVLLK